MNKMEAREGELFCWVTWKELEGGECDKWVQRKQLGH